MAERAKHARSDAAISPMRALIALTDSEMRSNAARACSTTAAPSSERCAPASTGPGISRRTPPNRRVDVSSRNAAFHDGALAGVSAAVCERSAR